MIRRDGAQNTNNAKLFDLVWIYSHFLHRVPGWPGFADAVFSETGSWCPEFSSTASIGPAGDYFPQDEAEIKAIKQGRNLYEEAWKKIVKMKPRPNMVLIQSWNNFRDATEVNRSKEFGSRFLDITQIYSEIYKGTAPRSCP